jgi:hypothetical protein
MDKTHLNELPYTLDVYCRYQRQESDSNRGTDISRLAKQAANKICIKKIARATSQPQLRPTRPGRGIAIYRRPCGSANPAGSVAGFGLCSTMEESPREYETETLEEPQTKKKA